MWYFEVSINILSTVVLETSPYLVGNFSHSQKFFNLRHYHVWNWGTPADGLIVHFCTSLHPLYTKFFMTIHIGHLEINFNIGWPTKPQKSNQRPQFTLARVSIFPSIVNGCRVKTQHRRDAWTSQNSGGRSKEWVAVVRFNTAGSVEKEAFWRPCFTENPRRSIVISCKTFIVLRLSYTLKEMQLFKSC